MSPEPEPAQSPDEVGLLRRLLDGVTEAFSVKNILGFFAVIALLILGLNPQILWEFIRNAIVGTPQHTLFFTTSILILAYAAMFLVSWSYQGVLRRQNAEAFRAYTSFLDRIPKRLSTYVFPLASIVLVMAVQVVSLQEGAIRGTELGYSLAHNFTRVILLVMIGMELAYSAQEHYGDHRWWVLVTVSLLLDFVSYIILIAAVSPPDLSPVPAPTAAATAVPAPTPAPTATATAVPLTFQVWFIFFLGFASLISSYFTITRARIADEVLRAHSEVTNGLPR